jgi:hypothetical protein
VFLLGDTARLKERNSLEEWLQATRERSTIMSRALDLDDIAKGMLKLGLATFQDRVGLADALVGLLGQADKTTLQAIARLLLRVSPPSWLWFAIRDGHVVREYMPTGALDILDWLEPDLDAVLVDVHEAVVGREDCSFRKAMGDAAEFFILAALEHAGAKPVHVSRLSDSYGYDIECRETEVDRIEVKAASLTSQASFHITRNEFEKSARYGLQWRLVQVVFSSQSFMADRLEASHVISIRQLRHRVLEELVPPDTPTFRWAESAKITPPDEAWEPAHISLNPHFSTAGFRYGQPVVAAVPG